MRFPGKRKSKYYFPVNVRGPLPQQIQPEDESSVSWAVGVDQVLVDIEVKVGEVFIVHYDLSAGHSLMIENGVAETLYQELMRSSFITHQFIGGTIGSTMHNYSMLADDRSVLLGVMCGNIDIGGYVYHYLYNTSSHTDLNYLQSIDGAIGRCFTLISDSGEHTFAISSGHINKLRPESIPEAVITGTSTLVPTSYPVRCKPGEPILGTMMKAIEYAKEHDILVVLTLETECVITDNPTQWQQFLQEYVSILAINREEGGALTGFTDSLSAADKALDWIDPVLCTAGPASLYMVGFTEEEVKQKTQYPLLPGTIPEFSQPEFSRMMRHRDCVNPLRIYSHTAPYVGGSEKVMNISGAGDNVLAALLHDIAANSYHRDSVSNSSEHRCEWSAYPSLAQVCKYANYVSYQVLNQHLSRLTRGLPKREDNLEEAYWGR